MTTFTIDSENTIIANAGRPASADGESIFSNMKELAGVSKDWPLTRFVEIWNSFAGAPPFDDLKQTNKFASRKAAIAKIWNAIRHLSQDADGTHRAESPRKNSKVTSSKKRTRAKEAQPKKDQVIGLMKRSKGATLAEIVEATGWQKPPSVAS